MKLKITVHGVAYEVDVEVLDAADEMQGVAPALPVADPAPMPSRASQAGPVATVEPAPHPAGSGDGGVASPIAGTVLEVKVKPGDRVAQNQELLVIEAMKMETAIAAPAAGVVSAVHVAAGDTVRENQKLIDLGG